MAKKKRRFVGFGNVPQPSSLVVAGMVSPPRAVPAHVERPSYAIGAKRQAAELHSRSALTRTPAELAAMRRTGAIAAEILLRAGEMVRPGITTDKIDKFVHDLAIEKGCYPSPLNYRGFPKSVCTSINEVICHGIPDSRPLREGDIINIDVTVFREGVHGDTSTTFLVGEVDPASLHLVRTTLESLDAGIAALSNNPRVNSIGAAIERHARKNRLGVVREFIGHGVGSEFHADLQIPHFYEKRANNIIVEGTTFTIEPMLTLGSPAVEMWPDDWTAVTADKSRSAQFEHTLVMTSDGAERLTVTEAGECAHELVRAQVGASQG